MPVRVKIPIRLRVDPAALARPDAGLEDALEAALARALARSRRAVVAPRGGVPVVRPKAPELTWGGPALSHVPEHTRRDVEDRIAKLVARACADSGILTRPHAPEVLPEHVAERVERGRMLLGAYRTPSYGGDEEEIPYDPAYDTSVTDPGRYSYEWVPWDMPPEIQRFMYIRSLYRDRGGVPKSGYCGAVVYMGHGIAEKSRRFAFPIFDFSQEGQPNFEDGKAAFFMWGDISAHVLDTKSGKLVRVLPAMPPIGEYEIRRQYPLSTNEQKLDLVRDYTEDDLRQAIAADPSLDPAAAEENLKKAKQLAADSLSSEAQWGTLIIAPGGGKFVITSTEEIKLPPLPVYCYPLNNDAPFAIGEGEGDKGQGKKDGDPAKTAAQGKDGDGKQGGKGKKGKDGKGDDLHEGQGNEGGYIVNPNASGDKAPSFAFPPGDGDSETLSCDPFEDEPPVDQWKNADEIRRLIKVIAGRLRIPECEYPGRFCINAAKTLGGRATAVAKSAVNDTTYTDEMKPKSGFIIRPVPTLAVQFLRHLGGTVPIITRLHDLFFAERGGSWTLHFREEYAPVLRGSIGWIFMYACQIAFLQQLRYSRKQIDLRVAKFDDGYADFFQETVLQLLTEPATLGNLRESLVRFLAVKLDSTDAVARAAVDEWRRAHRSIDLASEIAQDEIDAGPHMIAAPDATWADAQSDVIGLIAPVATATGASSSKAPGTVAKKGGEWAIRDKDGRLWTLKDLDTAIALQQGTAESVDPLVKQILDVEGLVPLFKANPWMIKPHLARLLDEMQQKNDEITGKVSGSATWAFEKGPISEDIEHATVPYCKYQLGGIHLAAHALIYDAFQGDTEYADAINDLFDAIEGWRSFKEFFMVAGIIILAVVCPEAAAVIGILQAEAEREDAEEMKDVYRSLIDPDVVISKAELEIKQFMAELMLAVSIIPEAGNIIKGASGLAEAALKGTVREFAKEAMGALMKQVIKALQKNLVKALLKEVVMFEVFGKLMEKVMTPLAKAIEEEASMPAVAGSAPTAADLGLATADDVLAGVPVEFDQLPEYPVEKDD